MPWTFDADGKWLWDYTCETCHGRGHTRRPINPDNPRERWWWERGSDEWHTPCAICKGGGRVLPPDHSDLTEWERLIRATPEDADTAIRKMWGEDR